MIVVRVELHSAVTGEVEEIARAVIDNIGGTEQLGDYRVRTLRGRSRVMLDVALAQLRCPSARATKAVTREGRVSRHPRLREHVWHLVAKALAACDYGKPTK